MSFDERQEEPSELETRATDKACKREPDAGSPPVPSGTPGDTTALRAPVSSTPRPRGAHATGSEGSLASKIERLAPGTRMGRYILIEQVGAGGMGVVYKAYDPELDRPIALKLLHLDPVEDENVLQARARLLREAQALARLNHPNVIAVYDVGIVLDQVFVAMEFVEGQTLRAWLKAASRSRQEILRVFREAAQGLAGAHRAGIVHRDFKPDNVILGSDGRVRVLDFGLACGVHGDDQEIPVYGSPTESDSGRRWLGSELTHAGTLIGTPRYMAPEQHLGEPTDARTDQFSFCLALYEALYGESPFAERSRDEFRQAVIEGRVREPRGSANVPGWLRRILRRGLAVRPSDRFDSMEELLARLDADPRTRWRRHGALLLLVGLAVFLGTILLQGQQNQRRACRSAGDALTDVWDPNIRLAIQRAFRATGALNADPTYRRIAQLLDAYTAKWVQTRTEACEATRVRGEQSESLMDLRMYCLDQRLTQVRALTKVFATQSDSRTVDRAVEAVVALPAVAHCDDVRALTTAVPPPENPDQRRRTDRLEERFAEVKAHYDAGLYVEGRQKLDRLMPEILGLGHKPLEGRAYLLLGLLQDRLEEWQAAAESLYAAGQAASEAHDDLTVAEAWSQMVWVLGYQQGWLDEANLMGKIALAAAARAGNVPRIRAKILHRLASAQDVARGNFIKAAHYDEQALAVLSAANDPDDPELGTIHNNYAVDLLQLLELEKAEHHLRETMAIYNRTLGPGHYNFGNPYMNLGRIYLLRSKHDDAAHWFERAAALYEARLGRVHPKVAQALGYVAMARLGQGDIQGALELSEEAMDIIRVKAGPDNVRMAAHLATRGKALRTEGRWTEAESDFERAVRLLERHTAPTNTSLVEPLLDLGNVLNTTGRPSEARERCQRALDLAAGFGASMRYQIESGRALTCLARARLAQGRPRQALELLESALAALENIPTGERFLPETQLAAAQALWESGGDRARALALAELAAATYAEAGAAVRLELNRATKWLVARRQPTVALE